jgi:hypothetical protein
MSDNQMTTEQVKEWRQALDNEWQRRINAGLRIDPENCEVECVRHASFSDPYGVLHGLTDDQQVAILEFDTIDQNWFARAADSDTWVLFEHLPEATRAASENKWWKGPSMGTIDPKTAEVVWGEALTRDPDGKLQVVREYFARSPGSGAYAWVNFHDLPEATRDALWKKHRRKLAFPPGLQARLTAEERRQSVEVVDE